MLFFRSGTTFVHRLLSLDPRSHGPVTWEIVNGVPGVPTSASDDELERDRASRKEVMKQRVAQKLALGMKTVEQFHEIGYDLEEECLFGMNDEAPIGLHYIWCATVDKENYDASVSSSQIVRAYQSWKRQLQLMMFQRRGEQAKNPKRWVLKCPLHINYIKELAEVFPDAKLVW